MAPWAFVLCLFVLSQMNCKTVPLRKKTWITNNLTDRPVDQAVMKCDENTPWSSVCFSYIKRHGLTSWCNPALILDRTCKSYSSYFGLLYEVMKLMGWLDVQFMPIYCDGQGASSQSIKISILHFCFDYRLISGQSV